MPYIAKCLTLTHCFSFIGGSALGESSEAPVTVTLKIVGILPPKAGIEALITNPHVPSSTVHDLTGPRTSARVL